MKCDHAIYEYANIVKDNNVKKVEDVFRSSRTFNHGQKYAVTDFLNMDADHQQDSQLKQITNIFKMHGDNDKTYINDSTDY